MDREKRRRNIGIVTHAVSETGKVPLSNLAEVICAFSDDVHVITGPLFTSSRQEIHSYGIEDKGGTNVITIILNYIKTQLRICYRLIKLRRDVDLWIMFLGGERFLLPILVAKLSGKTVIIVNAASGVKAAQVEGDPLWQILALKLLRRATYHFSDRIILYSERMMEECGAERYRSKVSIATKHFLALDTFKIQTPLKRRDNLVGYIGSLSQRKGIPNLLRAITEVARRRNDINFLIGGKGPLRAEIREYLTGQNLDNRVRFIDWIPHEQLPKHLNQLKLLVLPSYAEGLPNIILEAMACGTPVLATAVDAIPDVIRDGETGFILEDNSPECIARNVIRVLDYPKLDGIVMRAHVLIEKEFTYEAAVEKYRSALSGLMKANK